MTISLRRVILYVQERECQKKKINAGIVTSRQDIIKTRCISKRGLESTALKRATIAHDKIEIWQKFAQREQLKIAHIAVRISPCRVPIIPLIVVANVRADILKGLYIVKCLKANYHREYC